MQILSDDVVMVNPETGMIDEQVDAVIDATDQAFNLGHQDATEGRRQDAFIYPANGVAWLAYHEGYRQGSIVAAILTGTTRRYWDPAQPTEIQSVSWNSRSTMGLYRCPICEQYYDPTYGHQCPGQSVSAEMIQQMSDAASEVRAGRGRSWEEVDASYVPFQMPAEAYADVRFAEDREDYIGL